MWHSICEPRKLSVFPVRVLEHSKMSSVKDGWRTVVDFIFQTWSQQYRFHLTHTSYTLTLAPFHREVRLLATLFEPGPLFVAALTNGIQ